MRDAIVCNPLLLNEVLNDLEDAGINWRGHITYVLNHEKKHRDLHVYFVEAKIDLAHYASLPCFCADYVIERFLIPSTERIGVKWLAIQDVKNVNNYYDKNSGDRQELILNVGRLAMHLAIGDITLNDLDFLANEHLNALLTISNFFKDIEKPEDLRLFLLKTKDLYLTVIRLLSQTV